MDSSLNEKVKVSIQNLRDKKSRIYLLVQDTKGNARASVRLIYQMAKSLLDSGFNPIILHEKNDYAGIVAWMDEEYMSIPHRAIEGQNLEIAPEDFIVIPEIFGFIMEQIKNLPCGKIVLTQNYSHIVETLQPGQNLATAQGTQLVPINNINANKIATNRAKNIVNVKDPIYILRRPSRLKVFS